AVLVLEGDINSVQPSKLIESILQQSSGYTINIIDIKPSRLILKGSQRLSEKSHLLHPSPLNPPILGDF
ncbi:hypothetical protein, partial [Moorena sp. SIO3B2]|uniref:hypothetical protein n=1 Tax=Moorena sp. SIO3B2 TaxID=2607827 RepID=UPI0025807C63